MRGKFILTADHELVETSDLMVWARWFETADRTVGNDQIGDVCVSTVFLGLEPPLLFETMIFGGEKNGWSERYSTWAEAAQGHQDLLALVKGDAMTQAMLQFVTHKPPSLTDRLAAFFRTFPDTWVDGAALGEVAGKYAWRSRIADVRRQHGMTIENRQRRVQFGVQKFVVSEYRYRPPGLTHGG